MNNLMSPEFAQAFILATKSIEGVVKGSINPHYKSKYADLGSVIDAVKGALLANHITFIQKLIPDNSGSKCVIIQTILIYKTGEMMDLGTIAVPVEKTTPQSMGSAITYARRYALATALGVPAYDDDGNAASLPEPKNVAPSQHSDEPVIYFVPNISKQQIDWFVKQGATRDERGFWWSDRILEKAAKHIVRDQEHAEQLLLLDKKAKQLAANVGEIESIKI